MLATMEFSSRAYGFMVDSELETPVYKHGAFIVVDPECTIENRKQVFVELVDGKRMLRRVTIKDDSYDFTGNTFIDGVLTPENIIVKKENISFMHKIVMIKETESNLWRNFFEELQQRRYGL